MARNRKWMLGVLLAVLLAEFPTGQRIIAGIGQSPQYEPIVPQGTAVGLTDTKEPSREEEPDNFWDMVIQEDRWMIFQRSVGRAVN